MLGLVIGVMMPMRVRMPGAVRVLVLMLVEDDLQASAERVRDPTQRAEARDMIAALKARDHRLGHSEPFRQLLLRLAGIGAKVEKAMGALGGDRGTVVQRALPQGELARWLHGRT